MNKNISGGYTFNAGLESRRGQAKYIKLDKLFMDPAFIIEVSLHSSTSIINQLLIDDPYS
jgi:hypothetical protein